MRVVAAILSLTSANLMACGPAPQRVVETIEVFAPMSQVIEVLQQPEAMVQWHPMIQTVKPLPSLPLSDHEDQPQTTRREIIFNNGWILKEELRSPYKPEIIEDSWMLSGNFPVSQYRGVLQLKPTTSPDKTMIVWTARFNNQANLLEAPQGQDNATAIAAVTAFYRQGLTGLKRYLEHPSFQHSY